MSRADTSYTPALSPSTAPSSLGAESTPRGEDPNLGAFIRLCLESDKVDLYTEAHRQFDRLLLTRVLEETGGNQQQAARRLGISRDTLRRRLRELGLQVTRQLGADDDPA